MREAMDAYLDQHTAAGKLLQYPLDDWFEHYSKIDGGLKDEAAANRHFQAEVFAQLGRMYHEMPEAMAQELPKAYDLFRRTDEILKASPETTAREAIRRALRETDSDGLQVKAGPGAEDARGAGVRDTAPRRMARSRGEREGENAGRGAEDQGSLEEPHRIAGGGYPEPRIYSNGRIVGAPPGKDTVADRDALVKQVSQQMLHKDAMWEQSHVWYEVSGDAIRRLTHGDRDLAEKVTRLMALYSQGNHVGANTTAAFAIGSKCRVAPM